MKLIQVRMDPLLPRAQEEMTEENAVIETEQVVRAHMGNIIQIF